MRLQGEENPTNNLHQSLKTPSFAYKKITCEIFNKRFAPRELPPTERQQLNYTTLVEVLTLKHSAVRPFRAGNMTADCLSSNFCFLGENKGREKVAIIFNSVLFI